MLRRPLFRPGALGGACALAALALATAPATAGAAAKERLPDLDPDAPEGVNVLRPDDEPGRSYLTFGTVVYNVGKGPLLVRGHRASAADPTMVADQAVQEKGGGERIFSDVGTIRYEAEDEYERWGLESFLRYELRRAENGRVVGRGSAADWCVVDFRHLERRKRLRGEPDGPVFRDRCHEDDPEALELEMGISVGWGNFHRSFRKGQVIDITDLATGQYVLVYRANPRKALHESTYRNNASSALLSIKRRKGGKHSVDVVRYCVDSAKCKPRKGKGK